MTDYAIMFQSMMFKLIVASFAIAAAVAWLFLVEWLLDLSLAEVSSELREGEGLGLAIFLGAIFVGMCILLSGALS